VIVFPTFKETVPHRHDFLHIFFLGDDEKCDEILVTGSGMVHTMPGTDECKVFLMIDPTSDLSDYLRCNLLQSGEPVRINIDKPLYLSKVSGDDTVEEEIERWLKDNGFCIKRPKEESIEDYRVVRLIQEIRDYRHLEKRISEIADEYGLSESRLSHAFKESVGISLKGYLTIARLKYAYKLVMEGKSKTFAALEAGFSTPAHLAYICKKQMGVSITEVLK
jgi:AraC-like DNA-binding protein